MIAVFWLQWSGSGAASAHHENFNANQLAEALRFAEDLRRRRREGEPISHVAIQSELPHAVGEAGVKDAPADYAHYKRRLDPAIPLGRPSGSGVAAAPAGDDAGPCSGSDSGAPGA